MDKYDSTSWISAARISALAGYADLAGAADAMPDKLSIGECPKLILHQIAAWPDTLTEVGMMISRAADLADQPKSNRASTHATNSVALLRIAPLKWWLIGCMPPKITADMGSTLDLSHAFSHLTIRGACATNLLNRHMAIDLRPQNFPINAVASTAIHHIGVTLWRAGDGYNLFIPRSFTLSVWELLHNSAAQFHIASSN